MKKVCAWCGVDLGEAETERSAQDIISHGLCEECAHHLFAQMGMPLRQYINGLGAPVAVVDANGVVKTANLQASELLQKALASIEGYKGGDVFECAHASLPGGCGQTVHCSGCTIRRTVMHTFDTGQSCLNTPAYLNRTASGGVERLELLISTEKVGDVVLLRIDAVGGQKL
jgi:hypothetical protein